MSTRLLDVERTVKPKWTGTSAIVPVDRSRCLWCGSDLDTESYRQSALFWGLGCGATLQTTFTRCGSCGWFFKIDTTEVRPDDEERAIARRRTA